MPGAAIDQLFINFIGYNKKVVFDRQIRQSPQAFLAVDGTGGVIGRADNDGLCGRADRLFNGLQVQFIGILFQITENRLCSGQLDDLRIADIAGRGNDDFIPVCCDGHQGQVQTLLGTDKDQNLFRRIADMILLFQFLRDRLPQFINTHAGRVMGEIILDRFNAGCFDMSRGREIRFSYVKRNDLPALPAKGGDSGDHGGSC